MLGFDYYSIERNEIISGGKDKIAVWMLDTDYDGLTITPTQIFFPMDGTHTWKQVKQSLRAEIDESKFETLKGCVSLPFKMRDSKDAKIAVKVVDDRGIESMRVFRRIDE